MAPWSKHNCNYYKHPWAYNGPEPDGLDRASIGGLKREERRVVSDPVERRRARSPSSSASTTRSKSINTNTNTELKISLAAKDMAKQISESKEFWKAFNGEFESEVAEIKQYADEDILQQLWRNKIEYDAEFRYEGNQEHEHFVFHQMKLEACLDLVDKAGIAYTKSRPEIGSPVHDSRQLALDKIREAGSLVLNLAEKFTLDNLAFDDLVAEASNLEKLVDPNSPDAQLLHQPGKRNPKTSTPQEDEITEEQNIEDLVPLSRANSKKKPYLLS